LCRQDIFSNFESNIKMMNCNLSGMQTICGCELSMVDDGGSYQGIHLDGGFLQGVEDGNVDVVCHALDLKVDVNSVNSFGCPALVLACTKGYCLIAEILMKRGADINIPNPEGWTPLHGASYFGHVGIVGLLLKYNADTYAINNMQKTPGIEYDEKVAKNTRLVILGMIENQNELLRIQRKRALKIPALISPFKTATLAPEPENLELNVEVLSLDPDHKPATSLAPDTAVLSPDPDYKATTASSEPVLENRHSKQVACCCCLIS